MRSDLTDITLVVDRSGSMSSVRQEAEGGINAFIAEQAKEPGEALLTLVQFDTQYEFLHHGVPIAEVEEYHLVPRGMTALLDAVGRAIHEVGERLAKLEEAQRPGLVIFVVMTDGLENSSREFTKQQIHQMIQHQQEKYQWQFTFLGADQNAFAEARAMGIDTAGTANFSKHKVTDAYSSTTSKISRMRRQSMAETMISNEFTDEEMDAMK